jgi:vacuolar-type H+-ATPase subunit H
LHQLNIIVEEVLKDRGSKILWKEKKYIQQIIVERDKLVQRTLTEGRSYAEQYEGHYRELIEEFIKKLEMEISLHLDELQKGIETDKESIFNESYKKIELITGKADNARIDIHRLLQVAAVMKREELMKMIDARYKDKTSQHLGYEQFRTLNLQVYSTVGSKKDGQGCEVIPVPTRQEFINEINNAKPHQPAIKRTVYLKSEFTRQQANL